MPNDARFKQKVAFAIAKNRTRILSGSATTYHSASLLFAESGSVVNLHSPILIPAATASSFPTPNEGTGSLYVSAVNYKLYFQDSYGNEYDLTVGSTPGGELTASNIEIDGSTSGSIKFINDGVIYIKDNDATALQVQEATNAYMTFDTSNGSEKVIISKDIQVLSTDAGATAAPTVDFFRNSSSPDDSDIMGKITFTGKDEGDNTHEYAAIQSEINDVSGGGEDGVLLFSILKNANTKSALELKNNEAVFNNNGADIDFRIETDDFSGFVFIDGNINTMSIGSGSAAVASGFPAPQAILEITNKASGFEDVPLLQLNNNDVDMVALDINAANTTAHAVHVTADALTTGNGVFIASNSSATDSRNVLCADQQNASATSAIPLFVNQAANAALSGTPVDGGTPVAYFRQANANTAFGPEKFNRR
jgi:hypothetical protein